ncbi:MAG: DMT family transporter [Candidatus Micrarchaeaceae archaeon]
MQIQSILLSSVVFGAFSMLCYGISDILSGMVAKKNSATKLTLWYFAIGSVILAAMGLLLPMPHISVTDIAALALLSVISAAGLFSFYKGLRVGKVSVIVPVSATWSLITVLIGALLLKEGLNTVQYIGIALIILGTVLISIKIRYLIGLKLNKLAAGIPYAILSMVLWGFLYSGIGVISQQMHNWLWPVLINTIGSMIVMLLYVLSRKPDISFPGGISKYLILLWIATGVAGFLFYSMGTSTGYISVVGPISAAAPLITVILAMVVLKEKVSLHQAIGIALIILGLIAIVY